MTARSTRNKIRFQGLAALQDLEKAVAHLVRLAALAGDTSPYIDEHLPVLIAATETIRLTLKEFYEGL